MADIKVYGTLHAQTGDGIVARAAQIKDTNFNKTQQEINAQFQYEIEHGGGGGGGDVNVSVQGETIVFS